jgi:L-ascorbate metabolism protein UlaG (beta-lactamase superfamily)
MIRRMTPVLALIALAAWLLYLLGWFTPPRRWETATGWDRIPYPCVAARGAATTPDASCSSASAKLTPAALDEEFTLDWLGHSGFVLRWAGQTILLDPNTSLRCTVSRRAMELPEDIARVGAVDAVLISHAHYDHLNVDTLKRVERIGFTTIPAGAEGYLMESSAHTHPRAVVAHEKISLGPLEIFPVPAAHNGNRFHPLKSKIPAVGYIIRSPTRTLYYAGDTSFALDFASIRDRYHPDVAILPIGAYAPRIPLKFHHLNPEEAVQAAQILGAKTTIPCHFGTFTLSFDRPSSALPRFAAAAQAAGLSWVMPALAKTGRIISRQAAGVLPIANFQFPIVFLIGSWHLAIGNSTTVTFHP